MALVDAGSQRAHLGRVTEVTYPTATVQMEQEQISAPPRLLTLTWSIS